MSWIRLLWRLGRRQWSGALLLGALVATTVVLLTSTPALAAPTDPTPSPAATAPATPTPSDAATSRPDGSLTEEEKKKEADRLRRKFEKFWDEQHDVIGESMQKELLRQEQKRVRKLLQDEGGVLGVFNTTDKYGIPVSTYSVDGDTGSWYQWDLGVWNLLTSLCFMLTKWLIAFSCWMVAWALSFGLAKILLKPVLAVAESLHTRVIMELGLPTLFLTVCALICAWNIFFGDRARGWGDAALSILLAALTATAVITPPQQLMGGQDQGALGAVRQFSLEVTAIILDSTHPPGEQQDDNTPVTAAGLARPVTDALTDAFIAKPAQLIKYGRTFSDDCNERYAEALLDQLAWERKFDQRLSGAKDVIRGASKASVLGPLASTADSLGIDIPGADIPGDVLSKVTELSAEWTANHYGDKPMKVFEAECVPDAGTAMKASGDKLAGAFFVLVAAIIVFLLVVGIAGSFLVAQYRIAYDAIRGEAALVAGTVPGAGRAYLWSWCGSVSRSLIQLFGTVSMLGVFIVIIDALLDAPSEEYGSGGLTVRFLVVDVVCIGAYRKRKDIARKSRDVGNNIRNRLSNARVGGTGHSLLASPSDPDHTMNARDTTNAIIRTSMASSALARGNIRGAASSALRRDGASALATRLNHKPAKRRPTRPASRPATRRPATRPPGTSPTAAPPRPTHPPRPGHPPRPTRPPRRPRPTPRVPLQPPGSSRQAQLRARIDRRTNPPRPPRGPR
ncbi:Integral membrane protein OS=Streptomyces antimycoticus OX=68175 GN=SANT12839_101380 PE=4 SV=1 [Streptomyces antimycoticus]